MFTHSESNIQVLKIHRIEFYSLKFERPISDAQIRGIKFSIYIFLMQLKLYRSGLIAKIKATKFRFSRKSKLSGLTNKDKSN